MRRSSEDGFVLVMVLVFLFVIALVAGAVADEVNSSVGTTAVVHRKVVRLYAADAGVNQVIQELRTDSTLCGSKTGVEQTLPPTSITDPRYGDVTPVALSCTLSSGSSSGVFGYAVVTTDPSTGDIATQGGGTKTIRGPLWSANLSGSPQFTVKSGDVRVAQAQGPCVKPATVTVTPQPAYGYSCVSGTFPDPAPVLPAAPTLLNPSWVGTRTCHIFEPGTYTTALDLAAQNYFLSGVYYFQNVDIAARGVQIVAGRPSAFEQSQVAITNPCANDLAGSQFSPAVTPAGTGALFILGGTSTIAADSANGSGLEIFGRNNDPTVAQPNLSIATVQSDQGGYHHSTLTAGDDLINVSTGNNPQVAAHGLVYAPNAQATLDATNSSIAVLQGGSVVSRLALKSSASASGLDVSILTEDGARTVTIKAVAQGSNGASNITATAVASIGNTAQRPITVRSWQNSN